MSFECRPIETAACLCFAALRLFPSDRIADLDPLLACPYMCLIDTIALYQNSLNQRRHSARAHSFSGISFPGLCHSPMKISDIHYSDLHYVSLIADIITCLGKVRYLHHSIVSIPFLILSCFNLDHPTCRSLFWTIYLMLTSSYSSEIVSLQPRTHPFIQRLTFFGFGRTTCRISYSQ